MSFENSDVSRSGPSAVLIIFLVMPLLGLGLALGVLLSDRVTQEAATPETPQVPQVSLLNYPAADFTLTDITGDMVTLSALRGRVVLLNFWGTWCPPCVEELPTMERFAQQQGETGAVILAVNSTEDGATIQAFLEENAITIDAIPLLLDGDSAVYREYGIFQMPTTYVIDTAGMVVNVKYGAFDSVEELNATVAAAAAQ